MDDLRLLIAGIALLLGFWNYLRLQELDDKKEYKNKRILYQECLNEAKELLERITLETEELFVRRNHFDLLDSPYIGSYGYQQAYNEFITHIREVQALRTKIKAIYGNLSNYCALDDKEAFDKCVSVQKEMKDLF